MKYLLQGGPLPPVINPTYGGYFTPFITGKNIAYVIVTVSTLGGETCQQNDTEWRFPDW